METKLREPEDDRSPIEKFLTALAYRPKTKDWEPRAMADVAELARMRLAGETLPDIMDIPAWRKSRADSLKAQTV